MDHPEFLALPIGLAVSLAVAVLPGRLAPLLAVLVAEMVLLALWFATASDTICNSDMCRRELAIWDVYRMALIGGPAVVVAAVLVLKVWLAAATAQRRRQVEAFWAE